MSGCFPSPIAVVSENTPPRFDTSVTVPPPSQFDVEQTEVGGVKQPTRFFLRVIDPDPEPVSVRFFLDTLDYSTPDPFGQGVIVLAPQPGSDARDRAIQIPGFCDGIDLGSHDLEAWVTDTSFIDTAPFNEVTADPETGRRGTRDVIKWTVNCRLPSGG